MKKILSCLLLTYTWTLFANEQGVTSNVPSNEELQFVFEKNYLHAEDSLDFLYLYASKFAEEYPSSLTPNQLIEECKKLAATAEHQEKYLSIYRSSFNAEDIKKISELLQNENFMKYRQQLSIAQFKCHLEILKIMEEIVQQHPASESIIKQGHIPQLNKENKEQYFNSSKPLVIDVYTDWCGPCKYLAPILEELNEEYGHAYQFVKLNAEYESDLAKKEFKIEAFPTLIFIKNGQEVGRVIGFINKDKLLSKIHQYCD